MFCDRVQKLLAPTRFWSYIRSGRRSGVDLIAIRSSNLYHHFAAYVFAAFVYIYYLALWLPVLTNISLSY